MRSTDRLCCVAPYHDNEEAKRKGDDHDERQSEANYDRRRIPVASDEHSLTIGPDGPILLQDHYLIEQMANFNRERIPERQPHAKGGGAFGHFEVTANVGGFTKAAVFQPGTKTDTLIRFPRSPAKEAALIPGEILEDLRSSSIRPKVITTWWETTPRCSFSAIQ